MNTRGGGALEVRDHRLIENNSERGGALDSDHVDSETVSEEWGGGGERASVSVGADTKLKSETLVAWGWPRA